MVVEIAPNSGARDLQEDTMHGLIVDDLKATWKKRPLLMD